MNLCGLTEPLEPKDLIPPLPGTSFLCLQNFQLKEAIMTRARRNNSIIFNGETIMLFQDLSQITLRNRRALRPLLDKLRENDLKYTWHFPFALIVTQAGKQHVLRTPADLPGFYESLNLDPIALLEWYQEFAIPHAEGGPNRSPLSSPDKRTSKKMKHNRGPSLHGGEP